MTDDPQHPYETHTVEQRLDFLEADGAAQRRAIVELQRQVNPARLEVRDSMVAGHSRAILNLCNRVDGLEWCNKLVDWAVPALIGAVLYLTWFVLTK